MKVRVEGRLPTSEQQPVSNRHATPKMVEEYLPELAKALEVPLDQLKTWHGDLQRSHTFLVAINRAIQDVPEFAGVQFTDVSELRLYRCLLYLITRAVRPHIFVETGVLNGFSSAFVLLGMEHNSAGTLYSIDLPPVDERIRAQGTGPLPQDKKPGWAIPPELRPRHELHLGDARTVLPQLLGRNKPLDVFLHDSDHSYEHMMFELSLAWSYMRPGGWMLCDNVEANTAFFDFARGVDVSVFVASSFDSPQRTWKHGIAKKPAPHG